MNDNLIFSEPPIRSALAQFVANYCGDYYGIEDQADGECDRDFQMRVASSLRAKGKIIEAHEVLQGCRWDAQSGGGNVVDGLMGAMAIALNPRAHYGANMSRASYANEPHEAGYPREIMGALRPDDEREGERILADEHCAGVLVRDSIENPPLPPEMFALMLAMMGDKL